MKKRYAVCGISNRAIRMFIDSMYRRFGDTIELVALLDKDALRFDVCEASVDGCVDIPRYSETEFDKMVAEQKPDVVLVAGIDCTHVDYAVAALEKDLDVVIEKPMTTTAADAKAILDAEAKSKGTVTVTFNNRYIATHRKIKELILEGRVGKITSVDLNWYVATNHGASYFKRWNRLRKMSGGLSIHKCTHHFDLLNWWTGEEPLELFAYGGRNYFGADAPKNPAKVDGRHCKTCPDREQCAYEMRWKPRHRPVDALTSDDAGLDTLTSGDDTAYAYTGYSQDQCIFDSEIDIEDTYNVVIKYSNNISVSYSINYSAPFEGYSLAINGTEGRIESREYRAPDNVPFEVPNQTIDVFPLFGKSGREVIDVIHGTGSHLGGDNLLQPDVFLGPDKDSPLSLQAGALAGALSVAMGEATWRSVKEHRPVTIKELLG
jgi:predicted dehydrogenase